jgi:hypothetical protein
LPAKRRVKTAKTNSAFIYCVELELALTELLGPKGKWRGLAGAFENHLRIRSAILDATRVIRKRLDSILTADDRLRLTTDCHLDKIKRLAKFLKADGGGVLPLLANFIHLTAVLLGYDWLSGRPIGKSSTTKRLHSKLLMMRGDIPTAISSWENLSTNVALLLQ